MKAYVRKGGNVPLILEFSSSICSPHIKCQFQYKYFDVWIK